MKLNELKPSIFKSFPWESILQKSEDEQIAQNIMIIRARLGDKWDITWDEYKKEREKDGGWGCAYSEERYFKELMKQIPDVLGAIAFSPTWAKAARKALKK